MSKKTFIMTLILALTFAVSCDNNKKEEINTGTTQVEQEIGAESGEVVDRSAESVMQEPAELDDQVAEKGSTEVEYTTKRQVTETVLKERDIPTIQICETKANINEMDKDDFTALGFDPDAADKIVKAREQKGSFSSVDDLSQIEGVPAGTIGQLRNDLGVMQAQEEK